jgi:hypothetical protein
MNLNFTEVDDLANNDNFNINSYQTNNNYWETTKNQLEAPKKKKVSYDDILNSLNLVVNKNGVLQYMSVNPTGENNEQPQKQYNQNQQPQKQYNQNQQPQKQYNQNQQPQYNQQQTKTIAKGKPLEPQVKNSFIFNKYFKDYKDPNAEIVEEVKVPQTIEEYNRMVLEERIKRIQERNRIAQIKSTKMLFENNNNNNVNASKNSLRMMRFG